MANPLQLPDEPAARQILAPHYAERFAAYVKRRNAQHRHALTTVSHVARRFRMPQDDVVFCIEHDPEQRLTVSEFSYPAPGDIPQDGNWGQKMVAGWVPQVRPDAPVGRRLVSILGDEPEDAAEGAGAAAEGREPT